MASDFSIQFLGTRGSLPVTGPEHIEVGGATSCLLVRAGERELIFDAGSGILSRGDEVMAGYAERGGPITSDIFLTHCHLDHLIGLPYFAPMYVADSLVRIWGPRSTYFDSLGEAVQHFIHPPFFPVPLFEMNAEIEFSDFSEPEAVYYLADRDEPVQVRPSVRDGSNEPDPERVELSVETLRGYNHPKSGVNHYRITYGDKTVVYATDTEAYPRGDRRLIDFARDADVLIHDAMYTEEQYVGRPPTQGYGHSTVADATKVAEEAGVGRLFLFHHAPTSDDEVLEEMAERARSLFADSTLAGDGLTYEI